MKLHSKKVYVTLDGKTRYENEDLALSAAKSFLLKGQTLELEEKTLLFIDADYAEYDEWKNK